MLKIDIKDFVDSMTRLPMAFYFAWGDTRARYRRSVLGPLWLVIGTGIGVAGLGLIWSILLDQEKSTFIPSLTIGLVVWQLIAGVITDSASVFVRNSAIIKNIKTPLMIFPLQLILRHVINFAHNFIVVLIVFLIFPYPIGVEQLLIFPGLLLVVLNLFWISSFIAIVGARFRDIEQIVSSFIPLLFFLSPVIYKPDRLGFMESFAWFNPFSYFITLIRDPMQGAVPEIFVYVVSIFMLAISWLITMVIFSMKGKKISLWM